jgi:hypothetical protein
MKPSSRLSLLVRTALVAAPLLTSSLAFARPQSGADEAAPPAAQPAEPAGPSGPSAPSTAPAAGVTLGGGDTAELAKDHVAETKPEEKKDEKLNPIAGSVFWFDQSMTTQTAHLDTSPQQSYVPLYEWWLSFRPRWNFNKHLSYTFRLDYTKEMTNSGESTNYREDAFGDIWNTLRYKTAVSDKGALKHTDVSVSAVVKLPTSKESQDSGVYVIPGVGVGLKQTVPLNGESAKALNEMSFSLSSLYSHPFTRATTPTNNNLRVNRQSTEGRSFVSDQLRGGALTNHQLLSALGASLQITPKLSFGASMILINNWHYTPVETCVTTATGCVAVPRRGDSTNLAVNTWFIANVDYDLIDEVSLGLGYYNLANAIGPDGQRRGVIGHDNVWWSPDARVFFTITANLDKIFERVTGTKPKKELTKSSPSQKAAIQGIQNAAL